MNDDGPIVDEVRERRMEISEQFDHDLERYIKHLIEYQEQFRERLVSQITVVAPGTPRQQSKE
jgi:hypothetical protein